MSTVGPWRRPPFNEYWDMCALVRWYGDKAEKGKAAQVDFDGSWTVYAQGTGERLGGGKGSSLCDSINSLGDVMNRCDEVLKHLNKINKLC